MTQSSAYDQVACCTSRRWMLAYVGFVGFFCMYAMRVNISVAIVCMVNTTDDVINKTTDELLNCNGQIQNSSSYDTAEFYWDKNEQSLLLASYFYGYVFTQIPGGWLAGRFGGKWVIGVGISLSAILNALTPIAARTDIRLITAIRVLLGLSSGIMFPAFHTMWGKWAPPHERSRLTSFSYSGTFIGNIVTFAASGLLCAYGFDNGWGSIFYLTSIITGIWLFFWFFLVSDTPAHHPRISKQEKEYIESSIGDPRKRVLSTPWLAIAKSRPMQACLVAHICNNWFHYTLLTGLPTFMKEALKFDIKQNGALSAVPYIAMTISVILSGQAADFIITRGYWSTKTTRKTFQICAFLGGGSCLIATGFITCEHRFLAVGLLTLAVTFEGMCFAGYMVNQVDFAPRYAGVLFGINNAIATIPGMIAPIVAGALTPNKTQEEWRSVFYVCAGFCVLGATFFGLFAQTDLEPWAVEKIELCIDESQEKTNGIKSDQMKNFDNEAFVSSDLTESESVTKDEMGFYCVKL